jgi:RecB family endonuclease NucS
MVEAKQAQPESPELAKAAKSLATSRGLDWKTLDGEQKKSLKREVKARQRVGELAK